MSDLVLIWGDYAASVDMGAFCLLDWELEKTRKNSKPAQQ